MRIAGVSAAVPRDTIESTIALDRFPEHDVNRIVGNTGVKRKREAPHGTSVSDLCIAAAGPLLDDLGWERDTIDAVILVTTLSDHIMPASAHRAHAALGLSANCLVFDINLGCSGFTHGLILFDSLMKSGLVRRAVLLCGEMTSGTFRPRLTEVEHRSDLATAILFGDAGTATALESDGDTQVRSTVHGADGTGFDKIIVPGGAGRAFWSPELFERVVGEDGEERRPLDLILRGPEVLTFTMKRVPPMLKQLLADAEWTLDDIDAVVPHQANKFMLDFLARRMKIPADKVLLSIEDFGNTSSASIPLTLVVSGGQHLGRPTKWAMMGFGVGLSWSGLLLETAELRTLPLIEV
jgi:3-oxoacyl-[acyl-carrier-protein] synthase-3